MQQRLHRVLPIVLALLLPVLSILTNEQIDLSNLTLYFTIWMIPSLVLYSLWYLLWFLWDIRKAYRQTAYWVKLALALMGICGGLYLISNNPLAIAYISLTRPLLAIVIFLIIQYTLKTQENITRLQVEKEQIRTENYKAQLKVLHAKIDPHFLFNSLNTLRSMVRQGHNNSEKFILHLSDFYRQTLKHNENTQLPLSEELAILESYLFLMKNRNEEAIFVDINIDESLHHLHLPTLALQIVTENCFKHNSMTSKSPLRIHISSTNDGYIEVKNNIQPKLGLEESTGNGLNLLIKRYHLMNIPAGIKVEETLEEFRVKLKLITP